MYSVHGVKTEDRMFHCFVPPCVHVFRSRKIEAELVDVSLNGGKTARDAGMADCVGGLAAETVCGLAHVGRVTSLALEPTGSQQLLVSGGQDHCVKVWSVFNNQLLCALTDGHSQPVCTFTAILGLVVIVVVVVL